MTWGKTTGLAASTAIALIWTLTSVHGQEAPPPEADEEGGVERMTVTAQRREESLMDVPVAVSAFDAESIKARQIDNFSDLQFNVPNVSYTKTNFGGNNFQIRGIGNTLTATSADTGVGVHVNNVYLGSPRIFETEYFDIERVEILRGPQGTLYGRNATGGTINMITNRAELSEFEVSLDGQYGNFDHRKLSGHVNIPIIEDTMAIRLAGIYLERDGYTENIFNGNDIDGRDQFAFRGTFSWEPTERTRIDIIGSYFEEDSNRTRITKQLCNRDESAILGCLPDKLAFETVNATATLGGALVSDAVLGPLGLYPLINPDGSVNSTQNATNPADLRKISVDFDPIYKADETFVMIEIKHQLTDTLNLSAIGAYQETSVFSQQDYNGLVGDELVLPDLVPLLLPTTAANYFPNGQFPLSKITNTDSGVIGNNILGFSNTGDGYDQSSFEAEQYSIEVQLTSDFDGPLNFLLAGYYLDAETTDSDYYVVANALDYFSLVATATDGVALATPYFRSATPLYQLESYAIYGELYYQALDNLEFTAGIRYTVDDKLVNDFQAPLFTGGPALLGTDDLSDLFPPVREATAEFKEVTGRFVVEWSPDLDFTDSTLIYASYSRGYKGGGINPPFDTTLFPGTGESFDPEFLNAFEIGTKNELLSGRLQANLTGFYYDYTGLQVGRIVNRTSLNENVDATVWGVEGEFVANFTDRLLGYLTVSYLNTEVGDFATVDGRDPTGGERDTTTLLKDFTDASNCVVLDNGQAPFLTSPEAAALIGAGGLIPVQTEGFASTAFSSCAAVEQFLSDIGSQYIYAGGVPINLAGNELQNSPNWTISMGAQYTYPVTDAGHELVFRADYYWQADFFARIYNKPVDVVESWDNLNLSATFFGPDQRWYIRGFVSNVLNEDNITGHYFTDPSSGNFTNVFVLEPRLYGVNVGFTY